MIPLIETGKGVIQAAAITGASRRIRCVEAFEKAERKGIASLNLDGKMIDYPVVNRARNLLETIK